MNNSPDPNSNVQSYTQPPPVALVNPPGESEYIAGLVLGIIGLVGGSAVLIPSILAIYFGKRALSLGNPKGKVPVILGWIPLILILICLGIFVLIFSGLLAVVFGLSRGVH